MNSTDHELQQLRAKVQQQLKDSRPAPLHLWPLMLVTTMAAIALTMEWTSMPDSAGIAKAVLENADFKASAIAAMQVRDGLGSPVGTIVAWPSAKSSPPPEWLICDGRSVEFSEPLWAVLRGLYGNVEAERVARITLPDFQGCFLRGFGEPSGPIGTRQGPSVSALDMPFRNPTSPEGEPLFMTMTKSTVAEVSQGSTVIAQGLLGSQVPRRGYKDAAKGESTSEETRPKNYAVHWIIRVK